MTGQKQNILLSKIEMRKMTFHTLWHLRPLSLLLQTFYLSTPSHSFEPILHAYDSFIFEHAYVLCIPMFNVSF